MVNFQADPKLLDLLIKGLTELRGYGNEAENPPPQAGDQVRTRNTSAKQKPMNPDVNPQDINSVLSALVDLVTSSVEHNKKCREIQDKKIENLTIKVRQQDDHLDKIQQRGLKGNLILASPRSDGKTSIIKSEEELRKEGTSVSRHALDLIKSKYNVHLPEEDVQACHHLPNKSILIRVWNRRPGSAWSTLTQEIKKGGKKEVNVFANFHLTKRRNSILYHLRSLKKSGKISKLYSDENGQIGFKKNEKSDKTIVTYFSKSKDESSKTFSSEEIDILVNRN